MLTLFLPLECFDLGCPQQYMYIFNFTCHLAKKVVVKKKT